MSSGNLGEFGAYRKAMELFDGVVDDTTRFLADRKFERLVSQQLSSADSVCSNIEEGYGRESTVEYPCPSPLAPCHLPDIDPKHNLFPDIDPKYNLQSRPTSATIPPITIIRS